jgi:hypothetical protein
MHFVQAEFTQGECTKKIQSIGTLGKAALSILITITLFC